MHRDRARLVAVVILLFAGIAIHRMLYYGLRADIVLAWLDDPAIGGGGLQRAEAFDLYGWLGILTGWAPLVAGALALGLRRLALPAGGVLFIASGLILAFVAPTSLLGLSVFALGHGLIAASIYASAGTALPEDRTMRIGLFFLLTFGVSLGAVVGPWLSVSLTEIAGHRVWFILYALASFAIVAIGGVLVFLQRAVPETGGDRFGVRVGPIVAAALLVGWYWYAFAASLGWINPATTRWRAAGFDVAWIQKIPTTLLIVLAILFAVLTVVARLAGWRLPSAPMMLAFALATSGISVLLLIPVSSSVKPPVILILTQILLSVLGELALVVVIAGIASGFRIGLATLVVGAYLSIIMSPHLQNWARTFGEVASSPRIMGTAAVSLLLAVVVWLARSRLVKIEPAEPAP